MLWCSVEASVRSASNEYLRHFCFRRNKKKKFCEYPSPTPTPATLPIPPNTKALISRAMNCAKVLNTFPDKMAYAVQSIDQTAPEGSVSWRINLICSGCTLFAILGISINQDPLNCWSMHVIWTKLLTLSTVGNIFSRKQIQILFFTFPRKQDMTLHAILLSSICHQLNFPRER